MPQGNRFIQVWNAFSGLVWVNNQQQYNNKMNPNIVWVSVNNQQQYNNKMNPNREN
jgi:hypothetical protein